MFAIKNAVGQFYTATGWSYHETNAIPFPYYVNAKNYILNNNLDAKVVHMD